MLSMESSEHTVLGKVLPIGAAMLVVAGLASCNRANADGAPAVVTVTQTETGTPTPEDAQPVTPRARATESPQSTRIPESATAILPEATLSIEIPGPFHTKKAPPAENAKRNKDSGRFPAASTASCIGALCTSFIDGAQYARLAHGKEVVVTSVIKTGDQFDLRIVGPDMSDCREDPVILKEAVGTYKAGSVVTTISTCQDGLSRLYSSPIG